VTDWSTLTADRRADHADVRGQRQEHLKALKEAAKTAKEAAKKNKKK
jgi:hypothetical protein